MKKFNFRVRILSTIIIGVSLFSLISFTVFNFFLKDKLSTHSEETFNHINLLKDQYYFTISQHDGTIIKSMLQDLEKDRDVLRTYLVDSRRKVTYPGSYSSLGSDTLSFEKLYSQGKDITVKNYGKDPVPYDRIFIRLQNNNKCYACHNPSQVNLGMIVMDISNNETAGIISFTRQFGFYYNLFVLLCIFILVAYLHYKYIRKSLGQFRSAITRINEGNLDSRLVIPETRELGRLGKDFNEMVSTFEKTQKALQIYHQKEMQSSRKLATIGEMSARIAHEIRNPITGISRAMEIILTEMKDYENKPILEEIQRQANRVNEAITNLLRFSRSKDIKLEPGEINEIIKSLAFFLKNQASNKVIDFEMDLNPDIPIFAFDRELIENVIMNLSCNAIQAIRSKGKIKFRTWYDDERKMVLVSVRDSGSGVPSDIGEDIFKPFYTTRTKGTGLGLAISKDIMDKHMGELWFENNPDSGCTFFISLPV